MERIQPRRLGAGEWLVLLMLSIADAVSARGFLERIGTAPEANPLVVAVWDAYGFVGLLTAKIAVVLVFGSILVLIGTRLALAAMAALSGLTLWAVASNVYVLTTVPGLLGVVLFGPVQAVLIALLLFAISYWVVLPRVVERRRRPRQRNEGATKRAS